MWHFFAEALDRGLTAVDRGIRWSFGDDRGLDRGAMRTYEIGGKARTAMTAGMLCTAPVSVAMTAMTAPWTCQKKRLTADYGLKTCEG